MGVVVSAQLAGYLTAAVLGLAAGAVYDLLRVVRLRRRRNRRLTHALDGLFVAALALVSLWFALRVGQGELRLFMLSAMALGALVYALALSPLFLPLWDFWLSAAVGTVRLLLTPLRWAIRTAKKGAAAAKKAFLFRRKCAMIKTECSTEEGTAHGTAEENKKTHQRSAAAGADRSGRLVGH